MEGKICRVHEDEVLSVCFFEGCTQHFLCGECFGFHPVNHKSKIKSIMSQERNDDWIKSNEEQRDSQIAHIKHCLQTSGCLLDENQIKLQDMIEEMTKFLRKRFSEWTEELESLLDLRKNPQVNEILTNLESSLRSLENANFRVGDIYDKVDKVKLFNENILPNSREVCQKVEESMKEYKIDQSKLDSCKEEMIELLESIHLKDLFALSNSKRQKTSEQLDLLQQEYENLRQEKNTQNKQIERLAQDIKHLAKNNNDLQSQLNQLASVNNDYKQKIESLTITNKELIEEASAFESELNSVVATKLKLYADFERLNTVYKKLIEKYPREFVSEESLIIQDKDINTIRSWIQSPANLDKPGSFKLDLLYRATRDGFVSSAFQMKCKNKSPTIVFIKSKEQGIIFKEGGRVFGGYTTKNWKSSTLYNEDNEAFLFSLTHGEKYPIKNPQNAICGGRKYVLIFGEYDICIPEKCNTQSNKAWSWFPTSYECSEFANPEEPGATEYLAGSSKFTVDEIEVYQVVWLE